MDDFNVRHQSLILSFLREEMLHVTFDYLIPQETLYYQIAEAENGIDYLRLLYEQERQVEKADKTYLGESLSDVNNKIYKRMQRLLMRLTKNEGYKTTVNNLIIKDKIYDDRLVELEKETYQKMIPLLWETVLNGAFFDNELIFSDSFNKKMLKGLMLSIEEQERNKFTFLEAMFLSAIAIASDGNTIRAMNDPVDTAPKRKRAEIWMNNIKNTLYSADFHRALAATLTDLLNENIIKTYSTVFDEFIWEYWIEEKYKNRKDLERAFAHHRKECIDDYSSAEEAGRFLSKYEKYAEFDKIVTVIIPLVNLMLSGTIDTNLKLEDDITYPILDLVNNSDKIIREAYILREEKWITKEKSRILNEKNDAETRGEKYDEMEENKKIESECSIWGNEYHLACRYVEIVEKYIDFSREAVCELIECIPKISAIKNTTSTSK